MKLYFNLCFILTFIISIYSNNLFAFPSEKFSQIGFPNTLNGKDFFTIHSNFSSVNKQKQQSNIRPISCRDHIKEIMCLVDPMKEDEDIKNRPCLEGGQSYAIHFEQLYDNYPPALQKMFCSLKRIYIENQFFGTAYASLMYDTNGNRDGALIGIRKSVLDESLSLATWASWKEQLSFGGVTDSYTVTPDLPHVTTSSNSKANDFLYFVITHEFGHLFDFSNNLNEQINCPEPTPENEDPECKMAEGSWGAISWETDRKPKPINEFQNRSGLCFYVCEGKTLNKADVPGLYESLLKTDFVSTYSATQIWDDFAESLAYFTIDQKLASRYMLNTKQGKYYDSISKLSSPIFATKSQYLKNFLERTDILYP
ncbi:MAG: hypothetical protein PHY93_18575 [Bacteriovorax sp.]|nr:hypothetical protein [Bacteriovorax sp.]